MPDDKVVVTEGRESASTGNVEVVPVSIIKQVIIRTLRTYFQSLLGFILASAVGVTGQVLNIAPGNFGGLLWASAGLALAPATISLIQNLVEILTKLDTTNPTWRA